MNDLTLFLVGASVGVVLTTTAVVIAIGVAVYRRMKNK